MSWHSHYLESNNEWLNLIKLEARNNSEELIIEHRFFDEKAHYYDHFSISLIHIENTVSRPIIGIFLLLQKQ